MIQYGDPIHWPTNHIKTTVKIVEPQPKYDYLIVGAGPAGLHAAAELIHAGKKVLVVDKGPHIKSRKCPKQKSKKTSGCWCKICNVVCGLGGAGGKSDGKLLFSPTVGGNLYDLADKITVDNAINKVAAIYSRLSGKQPSPTNSKRKDALSRRCIQNGLLFKSYSEMHIGSDGMVDVISEFHGWLEFKGVEFWFDCPMHISDHEIFLSRHGIRFDVEHIANKVVIAIGRGGADDMQKLASANVISSKPKPIDIGFRLETVRSITDHITDVQYDFKIKSRFRDFEVRSYCVNPGGFVVTEYHKPWKINLVNGHSEAAVKSGNCNFAVLFKAELTRPASNTTLFGSSIGKVFHSLGMNKPIVQRLQDIYDGRRSTPNRISRSNVVPTLASAVPGNLGWAMPYDFMLGMLDYIKKLDSVIPGIANGYNTLLYGPEIKFQSMGVKLDDKFCANKDRGIYVIGDCSGRSGSIVSAAVNGILFAQRQLQSEVE